MPRREPPFLDRRDAGRQLAAALLYLRDSRPVVLALPRGGVPLGYEIALALGAPLDVLLVRKIGAPQFPELGIGAIAEDPGKEGIEEQAVLDVDLVRRVHATDAYLAHEQQRQAEEIGRRRVLYRRGQPRLDVHGRTVIVVDDGIATGGTMLAALRALAAAGAKELLFAVPVAPRERLGKLCEVADEAVCLLTPDDFGAVSQYYADFDQTTDEEVVGLLGALAKARGAVQTEEENRCNRFPK